MYSKPWIYLAGKITHNDWRRCIVPQFPDTVPGTPIELSHFTFSGPYTSQSNQPRDQIPHNCRQWIERAHLLYAWIDDPTCYGTLVEIGWAHMLRMPVYIAFATQELADEMWFPTRGPRTQSSIHSDPQTGLSKALEWIGACQ